MKLLNFTILKLTLCLIVGIVLGYIFSIDLRLNLLIGILLLGAFGLSNALIRRLNFGNHWPGTLIFASMVSIGVLTVNLHAEINFSDHYTKQEVKTNGLYEIRFRVREVLKTGFYHNKYVIDILKIDDEQVSGKALLNTDLDSTMPKLKVDDVLLVRGRFTDLNPSLNPHQFDYRAYLHRKYIYSQLSIKPNEALVIRSEPQNLLGYAARVREYIINTLEIHNFKREELDVIKALLLGQRQDISKNIYSDYTRAGAVHILAISGLHVGILLLILNYTFRPLEYLRHGRLIKIIAVLIILWGFAIIAGLSASVVRAVTMFSIFAIAMNLKRPTNIYNTLAISMFILLLIKPLFLFDVGFQLSYLAVLAIVSVQPMLYGIWRPKLQLLNFLWKVLSVTLAAQVGVVPISLYYFHQFPGLFFISNLVIIPVLGLILGLGILVIILSSLHLLPSFLANLYGNIIALMNSFVGMIADQEAFLIREIPFGFTELVMSYLLIILMVYSLKQKTYKSIILVLVCIVCCQGFFMYSRHQSKGAFIVFHKSRLSIIGIRFNQDLLIYHNNNDSIILEDRVVTQYKVGQGIINIRMDSLQAVYEWDKKRILVIDSLGVYNVKGFKPHIILLRNSPKINLKRVIDSLQPELIISDGSNYKSYQERWSRTCAAQKSLSTKPVKRELILFLYKVIA